ncbi:hypothetical protein B0J14DRAFT_561685 [Halenospora varia]|nr:hypothetical protein B0J14DRAFT_561685 [Halenospora varia]
MFGTLSAGGLRTIGCLINDDEALNEYINTTLAQVFSGLTLDDAPSNPQLANGDYMLVSTEERRPKRQEWEQTKTIRSTERTLRQNLHSLERSKNRRDKSARRNAPLVMSIKKDLASAQIHLVASSLIEGNAESLLIENWQFIYEVWASSTAPSTTNKNIDGLVVPAFDAVHSLAQSKTCMRLNLRFAFVHLNRVINILENQTGADYTNTYLNAKKNESCLSRTQLINYARNARRWSTLAGKSPFQLSVYSVLAETIMYVLSYFLDSFDNDLVSSNNNSIKSIKLKALADKVQDISPELVEILAGFDRCFHEDFITVLSPPL